MRCEERQEKGTEWKTSKASFSGAWGKPLTATRRRLSQPMRGAKPADEVLGQEQVAQRHAAGRNRDRLEPAGQAGAQVTREL